ncbi:josephin-2 [Coturnix japonica]|uniref:josephin-2 n=1 Tax=Coturnix japonica TaxID=93934 RepID=UPI000776E25F|nr:josephin-2 [Coturnix japonica]
MAALQSVGLAALWWDKRRPLSLLALPHIHGFILNVPTPLTLGSVSIPWWRRPHWLAIKQLGGVYYNLDSKLPQPRPIGDQEQLRSYLAGFLSHGDSQLFLVVSKDVEEDGTWLGPQ